MLKNKKYIKRCSCTYRYIPASIPPAFTWLIHILPLMLCPPPFFPVNNYWANLFAKHWGYIHELARTSLSLGLRFLPSSHNFPVPSWCITQISGSTTYTAGTQRALFDSRGSCQVVTNVYPRLYCLWTSGFGRILLFYKIRYFVSRSAAVHQKYNSVTNPASSWMIPLWTLKTI